MRAGAARALIEAAQRKIAEPARYRQILGSPRGRGDPKICRCTEAAQGRLFKSRPEPARPSPGGNFSTGAGARRAPVVGPVGPDGGKISPMAGYGPTGDVSATEGSANRAFAGVKTPSQASPKPPGSGQNRHPYPRRRGRAKRPSSLPSRGPGGAEPRFWAQRPKIADFGPKTTLTVTILAPKFH